MRSHKSAHLGDILDLSSNAQNPILYALYDLADTSLDLVLVPDPGNSLSLLSDDDPGLLGTDQGSDRDGTRTIFTGELDIVVLVGLVGSGVGVLLRRGRGGHLGVC